MRQNFNFTTAAMAAALEETPVTYEDLQDLEHAFDDAETDIIRFQAIRLADLYAARHKTVSEIPNFWPLVLEQAPPDIDQYIQPSDSALLLSALTNLSVSYFDIQNKARDPRSVSIKFEFSPNDYFEDKVLQKKFWYRSSKDGWCGLVSEPVKIHWKEDRDLTGGLLDMVCDAWDVSQSSRADGLSAEEKALKKKIDNTGMGGLSFFAWFGFIGRHVSAEESQKAVQVEKEKRAARSKSKGTNGTNGKLPDHEVEEAEEEDDLGMSLEIFPDGADLALSITEDLWPSAISYFTQAQEQDALSDADFESDDGNEEFDQASSDTEEDASEGGSHRPVKKQRTD